MTTKKMLITSKSDFMNLKKIVTKKCFDEKFTVAMNVVSEVLAEDAMVNLYFEDSRMLTTDEVIDLKNQGVL
jgi:hypothetical protein